MSYDENHNLPGDKTIRDIVSWDANLHEVELKGVGYVDNDIGFSNCGSDNKITLTKTNWNNIVCLDVKFFVLPFTVEKYKKYFEYIEKFLKSEGTKVFHPKIYIYNSPSPIEKSFCDLKKFIYDLNTLLELEINNKNFLEILMHFNYRETQQWKDDIIIELVEMINHSKFKFTEKNIFKKFII